MKISVLFSIIIVLLLSCSKEPSDDVVMFESSEDSALAVIQEADSLRNVRHGAFRGTHGHGKNAAVHAHQDVAKIRRVMRSEAIELQSRREAYRLQNEQRLRSYGLLDSTDADVEDTTTSDSSDSITQNTDSTATNQ